MLENLNIQLISVVMKVIISVLWAHVNIKYIKYIICSTMSILFTCFHFNGTYYLLTNRKKDEFVFQGVNQ